MNQRNHEYRYDLATTYIFLHTLPALSVTFEQVCQGLDRVIGNANNAVLSPCRRDTNCTVVQCQVADPTVSNLIQRSALTFLPCQKPPSVQLQLWNPAMEVLIDRVFNETQDARVDTGAGVLLLNVFVNQTTDSEIGIMVSNL